MAWVPTTDTNGLGERYLEYGDALASEVLAHVPRDIGCIIVDYAIGSKREYFYQMISAFPKDGITVSGSSPRGGSTLVMRIRSRPLIMSARTTFIYTHGEKETRHSCDTNPMRVVTYPYHVPLRISEIPDCPSTLMSLCLRQMYDIFDTMPLWPMPGQSPTPRPSRACVLM